MMRFLLILFCALSALGVVYTQNESRKRYSQAERGRNEGKLLDAEHERLVVEGGRMANPQRVAGVARAQGMVPISAARTVVVSQREAKDPTKDATK
jgi:cell division protein FtsL